MFMVFLSVCSIAIPSVPRWFDLESTIGRAWLQNPELVMPDLLFTHQGRRYGVEFKMSESPVATRSMHVALEDLSLAHLWIVYPGEASFPIGPRLSALPLGEVARAPRELQSRRKAR